MEYVLSCFIAFFLLLLADDDDDVECLPSSLSSSPF